MYIPKHFHHPDVEAALALVQELKFGILVNVDRQQPVATHIPMDVMTHPDGTRYLWGHMARANTQWRTLSGGRVLAIFSTPGAYISPAWYSHLNVPTANYVAVHIYGSVSLIEDKAELVRLLSHSTAVREKITNTHYSVAQLPEKFLEKELRGLVGFTLSIEEVLPNFKLSQNRTETDFSTIIEKLKETKNADNACIAAHMEAIRKS